MSRKNVKTVLLLFFLGILQTQAQSSLVIKLQNGSQKKFPLTSLRKITFPEGKMLLTEKNATETGFDKLSINSLFFEDATLNIENNFTENLQSLVVYPNPASDIIYINISDLEYSNVLIYGLEGILVLKTQVNTDNNSVDVSQLASGVYIIKVNNKVTRFRKL